MGLFSKGSKDEESKKGTSLNVDAGAAAGGGKAEPIGAGGYVPVEKIETEIDEESRFRQTVGLAKLNQLFKTSFFDSDALQNISELLGVEIDAYRSALFHSLNAVEWKYLGELKEEVYIMIIKSLYKKDGCITEEVIRRIFPALYERIWKEICPVEDPKETK